MKRNKQVKIRRSATLRKRSTSPTILPFIEHVHELRRRLMYVALSVALWSSAAYAIERRIINLLLQPAHGQNFIYTSPIDGINFQFKLCLYVGIGFSIPVIIYH